MAIVAVTKSTISGQKRADNKGRVSLGLDAVGKEFDVEINAQGQIILTPMMRIPEREAWLYRNPEALALFQQGLAQAANGQLTKPKDFSEYADIEDEDE